MTAQTALLLVGGPVELTGIVLISLDILMPGARGLAQSASRAEKRVLDRLRSLIPHLRGELTRVVQTAEMPIETVERASVMKRPDAEASLDEQIRQLGELQAETQERLNRLKSQLPVVEGRLARDIRNTRQEFLRALDQAMEKSEGMYLRWRAFGFILAVVGASLVYVAAIL